MQMLALLRALLAWGRAPPQCVVPGAPRDQQESTVVDWPSAGVVIGRVVAGLLTSLPDGLTVCSASWRSRPVRVDYGATDGALRVWLRRRGEGYLYRGYCDRWTPGGPDPEGVRAVRREEGGVEVSASVEELLAALAAAVREEHCGDFGVRVAVWGVGRLRASDVNRCWWTDAGLPQCAPTWDDEVRDATGVVAGDEADDEAGDDDGVWHLRQRLTWSEAQCLAALAVPGSVLGNSMGSTSTSTLAVA